MIKIFNERFYVSAGEACCIFRKHNGGLYQAYIGRRIEPEDDIALLGFGNKRSVVTLECDDKPCPLELESVGKITSKRTDAGAALGFVLADRANALAVELAITPHTRGGFSLDATIKNRGVKRRKVAAKLCVDIGGLCCYGIGESGAIEQLAAGETPRGMSNFAVATSTGVENHGDAYGFLCPLVDGDVGVTGDGDAIECRGDGMTLEAGGEMAFPEFLVVYSYRGRCGVTRVFHDILRERPIGGSTRSRSVLFLPEMDSGRACSAVSVAVELGFDVAAMDGNICAADIKKISDAAKAAGINPGLRVRGEDIALDKPERDVVAALIKLVVQNDIRYVMLDVPPIGKPHDIARRLGAVKSGLCAAVPDIVVDGGVVPEQLRNGYGMCYPVGRLRSVIEIEPRETFKLRFDRATLGALGYKFDPTTLDDGLKRAVRAQILSYQDDAPIVTNGDIYRIGVDGCRMAVSKDKARAYAVCIVTEPTSVKLIGLDEHNLYRVREIGRTFSGAALTRCGLAIPEPVGEKCSFTFHLQQVADYE